MAKGQTVNAVILRYYNNYNKSSKWEQIVSVDFRFVYNLMKLLNFTISNLQSYLIVYYVHYVKMLT